MNHSKVKLTLGAVALTVVSIAGLRDSGVFVADHTTTLYSGSQLSFQVEEEANIVENKENGYIVQKGNAKVTVPKNKILVTQGPVQKYTVKKNATINRNKKAVRNLFLGELVETVEMRENTVVVKAGDGVVGEVTKEALEPVEGPYVTKAKVKEATTLTKENAKFDLAKDQEVNVVSFQDGVFIIVDGQGNDFAIDPALLDFGEALNPVPQAQQQEQAQTQEEAAQDIVVESAPIANSSNVEHVLSSANNKIGSKYVWGGTGGAGYDCSGLVYAIYKNELGVNLPRTSRAQSGYGTQIARENLQAGDLIFFNTTGNGVSHVGIYIGNDEFIHAATGSKQVRKDKLSSNYYNTRYVNATRVL